MANRCLVIVPTYDERDNVRALAAELLRLTVPIDVLFIDDNSPDGTGEILDEIACREPSVHVQHRAAKMGIGSAHRAGIDWAYEHGYTHAVTMDCDFTHRPEDVVRLLEAADGADVVVGSRYMDPGSLPGWNLYRKTLTRTGHLLTRLALGMRFDATGAFRCYRLPTIPREAFALVSSPGYSFFFESLYILNRNGFRIAELPIALPARTYGHSKMDGREIRRSLKLLGVLCFKSLCNPEKFVVPEPLPPEIERSARGTQVPQWDQYWETQKASTGGLLYDAIAAFYRRFIIRPSLNRFVERYLAPGSRVLHAGCGSGQVDADVRQRVAITALDISTNALRLYGTLNKGCRLLHGSIMEIPLPPGSADGVYNLGVMEHFSEAEIRQALREFLRVLVPGGRLILFWPPEFGLSVLFFKALRVPFALAGRKDVRFHPDEITRLESREHARRLVEGSGFRVIDYSFGPRDLFTYSVVVAEKPAAA